MGGAGGVAGASRSGGAAVAAAADVDAARPSANARTRGRMSAAYRQRTPRDNVVSPRGERAQPSRSGTPRLPSRLELHVAPSYRLANRSSLKGTFMFTRRLSPLGLAALFLTAALA